MEQERKNHNKSLTTRKYTVTKQTAYHIARLAAMNSCTEGMILDKVIRSLMATYHTKGVLRDD